MLFRSLFLLLLGVLAQDPEFEAIQAQQNSCELILSTACASGNFDDPNCVNHYCCGNNPLGPCNPSCCTSANPSQCLMNGGSTATVVPSPTTTLPSLVTSCAQWSSIVASCTSKTPDLFSLPVSAQVACVCYDGGQAAPGRLDGAASACVTLYSSISQTSALSVFEGLTTFCQGNGVVTSSGVVPTSTMSSSGGSKSTGAAVIVRFVNDMVYIPFAGALAFI